MKTPLQRVRRGAFFLVTVSIASVCGYRVLADEHLVEFPWLGSLYWFVITVSSVGYSEVSRVAPTVQAFSIVVILVGLSAAIYTVGGFIQMLTEGEIERALGVRRLTRAIRNLKEHVIICGFGRMGQILAQELVLQKQPLLVIDINAERITEAQSLGFLALNGDATEEQVLVDAGVKRAQCLVSGLESDAENVFITLTSRNLNPQLQIIARAEHPASEKKLIQAGADRVILPMLAGAQRIARAITRPHTAELIDRVTDRDILDVELDELKITEATPLVGQTVRDAETHRRHRLLVVSVCQSDGEVIFNPDADHLFVAGDTIIVMGRSDDIANFRETYQI